MMFSPNWSQVAIQCTCHWWFRTRFLCKENRDTKFSSCNFGTHLGAPATALDQWQLYWMISTNSKANYENRVKEYRSYFYWAIIESIFVDSFSLFSRLVQCVVSIWPHATSIESAEELQPSPQSASPTPFGFLPDQCWQFPKSSVVPQFPAQRDFGAAPNYLSDLSVMKRFWILPAP